jgi:hypothetical protein
MPRFRVNSSRRLLHFGLLSWAMLTAGCHDTVSPPDDGVNVRSTVTLPLYGVSTIKGAGRVMLSNPGRYAVIPQFAATTDFAAPSDTRASVPDFQYAIGASGAVSAIVSTGRDVSPRISPAEVFHARLRDMERKSAPDAIAYADRRALEVQSGVALRVAVPVTRDFRVLASLSPSTYTTVTARLQFEGANILVYVDEQAPAAGGFTAADYVAFGHQFDLDLYPVDVAAFGRPSDVDANGRTFVLFTPAVNRLELTPGQCGSYVAGFVVGSDLTASAGANRAEIMYQAVPGVPTGGPSCSVLRADVLRRTAAATFIHELQHLISYNQHVLVRRGAAEANWLNEALSHVAEELGGKVYEARYPCPAFPICPSDGRASSGQLFPDSAQGFLTPNFSNAYGFFAAHGSFSLTSPTGYATLEERGVSWLFLRWLADQKGDRVLPALVQTNRTGTANIEAAAGEAFERLFADFLAATLLDDYPRAAPGDIATRHQFTSRNLRAIYARLHAIAPGAYPLAYPLDVTGLAVNERLTPTSATLTRSMKPGSLDLLEFTSTVPGDGLFFRGAPAPAFDRALKAQLTVVRLPELP